MLRLSPRSFAYLVLPTALVCAPAPAHAQLAERLYAHGEVGVGTMLTAPQSSRFGVGILLHARVGARLHDLVGLHLVVGSGWWQATDPADATARLTTLGVGLRFTPALPIGRAFIDVEGAYSVTGFATLERPYLSAGAGWLLPLGRGIVLGPALRYGHVFPSGTELEGSSQGGSGAAQFWNASVVFGWNGLAPAPPPPRPVQSLVVAPPPTDLDHDGVLDAEDQCPQVPMGTAPDPARRGCPRTDRDHDAVFDDEDQCPDEPQGTTPDPARRGCPSGDRDRDTVLDAVDLCPDTPRGPFPDVARPGCPTPDRDRDTVADAADRCPDQPGIPSANPAQNGCPTTVRIENGRLLLTRPVHFQRTRARIERRSLPLLEQVAEVLRLSPQIRRLSLNGHTDDRGDDQSNLVLSQDRMNAVRQWLIDHGVAPERLEAHGYGETRPIVPNESTRNRALNRRVEFIIVDPPTADEARATPAASPSGDESIERSPRRHRGSRHRRR